jgi:hypothetical protein
VSLRRRAGGHAVWVLTALCALALTGPPAAAAGGAAALGARARAAGGGCIVAGVGEPPQVPWRANLRSAIEYARRRRGDIAFAVRTPSALYGYRPDHREWSASALKAMLMVAYLDRPSVAGRTLNAGERSLLYPMITRSDNQAADVVDEIVGAGGLRLDRALPALGHRRGQPAWLEALLQGRLGIGHRADRQPGCPAAARLRAALDRRADDG